MANETTNYKFTKPAANEYYDVEVQNQNWDKVDETLKAKVNYSDVVNNCTSTDTDKPLSANQGKVLMDGKLAKTGDASNVTNAFSQASTRANLSTGEKLSVSLGKLMKWFADLKNVAFSGNASDLTQDSTHRMVTDTEKSTWNGKVTASGGDIQDTKVGAFTASTASWPVPAAGETVKVILGKIVKYFTDLNSWRSTVVLIANIVNNCTSTDTNKPLSANQGKVLMDGKAPKSHASTATTYGPGNASNYGHVKVSDNYTSSAGAASAGVAASSKAVADAYAKLNSDKAASSHAHDDRYFTESEINAKFARYAACYDGMGNNREQIYNLEVDASSFKTLIGQFYLISNICTGNPLYSYAFAYPIASGDGAFRVWLILGFDLRIAVKANINNGGWQHKIFS